MNPEVKEIGPEFLGIMIACPHCIDGGHDPNPDHARPLDVFFNQSELGRHVLGPLIERANSFISEGMEFDEAVAHAFQGSAIKAEDGSIQRLNDAELSEAKSEFNENEFVLIHNNKSETTVSSTTNQNLLGAEKQSDQAEKITVGNFSYSDTDGHMQVIGEVTNNDSASQPVTLRAVFYDQEDKIIGTATGNLDRLEPGISHSFALTTNDDVTGYTRINVSIVS